MLKAGPARLALQCACSALVFAPAALGPPSPRPLQVPIIQLIATPQRFDHKLVRTIGYLRFFVEHGIVIASGISPSQEESENGVGSGVAVQTTDQMAKNREKLDKMYVEIVGTVRIVHTENTPPLALLVNVRSCVPWPDPGHPIMNRPLQHRLPGHDPKPPVPILKQPLGDARGTYDPSGGEVNVDISGGATQAQFSEIGPGRYAPNLLTEITGIGPSLHVPAGPSGLDQFAQFFQESETGGAYSVSFTAHLDSDFAWNPIGAAAHYYTDVLGSATRNYCPAY